MPLSTSCFRPLFQHAGIAARSFTTSAPRSVSRMMITGRLANNPEVLNTSSGQEIIKYTIASPYGPRERRQTSFFRIASFPTPGPQRDHLLSLPKGTLVFVEGDASMKQWEDAEGKRNSALNIVQRTLEVLRRPASALGSQQPDQGQEPSSEYPPQ